MADPDSAPEKNETGLEQETAKEEAKKVNLGVRAWHALKYLGTEGTKRYLEWMKNGLINSALAVTDIVPIADQFEDAIKISFKAKAALKVAKWGGKAVGAMNKAAPGNDLLDFLDTKKDISPATMAALFAANTASAGVMPDATIEAIIQWYKDGKKVTSTFKEAKQIFTGEDKDYWANQAKIDEAIRQFIPEDGLAGAAA